MAVKKKAAKKKAAKTNAAKKKATKIVRRRSKYGDGTINTGPRRRALRH